MENVYCLPGTPYICLDMSVYLSVHVLSVSLLGGVSECAGRLGTTCPMCSQYQVGILERSRCSVQACVQEHVASILQVSLHMCGIGLQVCRQGQRQGASWWVAPKGSDVD